MKLETPSKVYSNEQICILLKKAKTLGFTLNAGSQLEKLSVEELDKLVNVKQ